MSLRNVPGWVLVTAFALFSFSIPVADNDLWGHVFFGHEILSSGHLPLVNQYSYTAPAYPWINHEVLAECAFAATYERLGSTGLLLLKLTLGLTTLAIMARTLRRRTTDPVATTVALVLATSLMAYGYLVRPQIFSFLALAVVWDRLVAYAEDRRTALWPLPLVFTVWINTHGGVMAGIAVLLAFSALCGLNPACRDRFRNVAIVSAISVCTLLLNPYGWNLPAFLLRDLLQSRGISEWAAIPLFDLSNPQFKAAVVVFAIGCARATARDLPELAIVGLVAAATFRHERHLPLFAILATPHIAATIGNLVQRLRLRVSDLSREAALALGVGILAIAALLLTDTWRIARSLRFQIYVSPEQFPIEAVRFIEREGLSGNLALSFDWGEYAIWHLYPSCLVSIDGRYTTAYPPEVIDRSWRFMSGDAGWDDILANASIALVDRHHGTAGRLAAAKEWRQVHADSTAVVFAREGMPASGGSRSLHIDSEPPTFP
jgi:hypothetical protein